MSGEALVVVGATLFGGYAAFDYIRHYLSKCPTCKGAGVLKSAIWSKQYRPCPRCKRKGEVRHGFAPKD